MAKMEIWHCDPEPVCEDVPGQILPDKLPMGDGFSYALVDGKYYRVATTARLTLKRNWQELVDERGLRKVPRPAVPTP